MKNLKDKKIKGKPSFRLSDKKAQMINKELKKIEGKHGYVTPKILLDEAKNRLHPLHNDFTWDNTIAGEKWRLEEARYLIRSVRIHWVNDNDEPREVRSYVSISNYEDETTTAPNKSYISIERALDSEEYKKQIIREAFEELQLWQDKYNDLKEFTVIYKAIGGLKLETIEPA